jgi:beta-glucosidase
VKTPMNTGDFHFQFFILLSPDALWYNKKMNKNDLQFLSFPRGFVWGVSTSAYQIEGGIANDWSEWESSPERLADLHARGRNVSEYQSGGAANSWELYEEDFNLVQELNCGAYRLGLEWSRIEPEEGRFSIEAIEHYKKMLQSLKERKIKIALTLWHWTNPLWLAKNGGWSRRQAVDYFERYVEVCSKEFGEFVDFWVVLNEPMVHVANGHLSGKFPPNVKNPIKALKVQKHLILAQKAAYAVIKSHYFEAKIGYTTLCNCIEPAHKNNIFELIIAKSFDYWWNWRFLNKTRKYFDFVGLDYYFHDSIIAKPPFRTKVTDDLTDFGWEIYPEGLYKIIKKAGKYRKPIYILENGLADANDTKRTRFIKSHLQQVHRAIMEDADVRGYFYWSLLDNFEWADGYWPQFGLYKVGRVTYERTARPSAADYAEICKNNGFWAEY